MRSGLVELTPGRALGEYSTRGHEELLIVLEGTGEFRMAGETLPLTAGSALHCPSRRTLIAFTTGAAPCAMSMSRPQPG